MNDNQNYPEGKLRPDDEGELNVKIGCFQGKVVIDFGGVPVTWLAMQPQQAREFANNILDKANKAMVN